MPNQAYRVAIPSGQYTQPQTSPLLQNFKCKEIIVYLDVTAGTSGALALQVQGIDNNTAVAYNLNATSSPINAVGHYAYVVGPSCVSATGDIVQTTQTIVPSQFKIHVDQGSSVNPMTYSVGYDLPTAF